MKTINLTSWCEFPAAIDTVKKEFGEYKIEGSGITYRNRVLYRGQTDSDWKLETTLERVSARTWTILDYAQAVVRCTPRIETFTEKEWNTTPYEELERHLDENPGEVALPNIPDYSFWVYLRHHGFPSPLLDWTASPLVAAFFAFADKSDSEKASIFAFVDSKMGVKGGFLGAPQINVRGPYVRTHKRHFLQQARYTICTFFKNNQHTFCSHEAVTSRGDKDQNILVKITIPRSERSKVLSNLNESNINYFTLFQSDEALIKTMAMEEIERIDL
ncbi:FRG domain-containing protein [Desulfosarcina widdelii]|uniref:FRG domain-containing protein n=1 Tax=Desulfosarcina widdelii TaxID=947919 RepID=A0A5K7Z4Q8_9BACT|nr:FRG domain-containing protein [Desulfosarcina widdelii]BBO73444.1 FRG domain-containing protein [Desulfosarcina widdelii]